MARQIALILVVLVTWASPVSSQEENTFKSAEFVFSADPSAAVLFVNVAVSMSMTSWSAILYGDGRLELQVKHIGTDTVLEAYEAWIEHGEIQEILRHAVNHGLAEWDGASVNARQLRARNGRAYVSSPDGPRVTVILSLESYSRGSYSKKGLEQSIRVRDPNRAAKKFPQISELQGLRDLQAWATDKLLKAKEKSAS